MMQAIRAKVHNQSMGPSFLAQIQAVAHQIVITGIPYSARNMDVPLTFTVMKELIQKMGMSTQDCEYLRPMDAFDIQKGASENMVIIASLRNAQAADQLFKNASRIPKTIKISRSVPKKYQDKYKDFRKIASQWSRMRSPEGQSLKRSRITFEEGWMVLYYSERIGQNTWTNWKISQTFYPPPEDKPPPLLPQEANKTSS